MKCKNCQLDYTFEKGIHHYTLWLCSKHNATFQMKYIDKPHPKTKVKPTAKKKYSLFDDGVGCKWDVKF